LPLAGLAVVYLAVQVRAVDPHRRISQYKLDRWGSERGFPGGTVSAIAQSSDGYLWIGTDKGLIRFDGSNFRNFPQATPVPFAIGPVRAMLPDSEENLWVLLESTKILRYRDGEFELGHDEAEFGVTAMIRRQTGAVLFSSLAFGVLTYDAEKFKILQSPGGERAGTAAAMAEPDDTLSSRLAWATSVATHRLAEPNSAVIAMAESSGGKVWLGTRDNGIFYMIDGRVSPVAGGLPRAKITCLLPLEGEKLWVGTEEGVVVWNGMKLTQAGVPSALRQTKVFAMMRDRDSNIWVGTANALLRLNSEGVSSLRGASPATSVPVNALFEDREGNLWAGGTRGIERLRDSAFITYSMGGQQSESSGPIYVDEDGRAWFAPYAGGLRWLKGGNTGSVTNDGLSQDVVYSIAGGKGELWIGRQQGGLTRLRYEDGRITTKTYTQADGLAKNAVYAVYRSQDGAVWAATLGGGVSEYSKEHFTTYSSANGMVSDTVSSITESADGTMWFATPNGLDALSHGQWHAYTVHDGLPSDNVDCLLLDSVGRLWIGTTSGLAFLSSGHVQQPGGGPASLYEPIFGIAEDKNGRLWIATSNHVLSVTREKLVGNGLDQADVREYGFEDGLQGTEGVKRQPSVFADMFGRVWFSLNRGLSVVDPGRTADSSAPALVHLEGLSADGNAIDLHQPLRLPPGGHRVTFSYSGLSLSAPDRVRYKYKLEGFDRGWSEPTAAHQAAYTNLHPGSYRFHVVASNGNGTWNGAEIPFEVYPAIWQTWWFQLCSVLMVVFAALAFYRLRMLKVTRQMNVRFEERLAERARIAQELHDTFLQGVISASMQLHVVADQVPESAAKSSINRVGALLRRVIDEGRNAVGGLRSSESRSADLGQAFSEIPREFPEHEDVKFRVIVAGPPQTLHPVIRDEIYSIGREAVTNAFRHSKATKIEVELEYASDEFSVLIRDTGIGFDSNVLRSGRDGHWGLTGMRERAKRIGARLGVLTRPDAGTEVELIVPGLICYISRASRKRPNWLLRRMVRGEHPIERSKKEQNQ
jgi:signal transduction histidine kinase/ligand-binding sensor domain-containing protein